MLMVVAQWPARAASFPPPWTAEEIQACFIVKDHNGRASSKLCQLHNSLGGGNAPQGGTEVVLVLLLEKDPPLTPDPALTPAPVLDRDGVLDP